MPEATIKSGLRCAFTEDMTLYEQIYDFDNLVAAYEEIETGKKRHKSFLNFDLYKEEAIFNAHNALVNKTYRPLPVNEFTIYEPKKRDIAAPKLQDRLVHHALMRVVLPLFEEYYHDCSYACRVGRGTLAAVLEWQKCIRSAIGKYGFEFTIIEIDIKDFFGTIRHDVLKVLLKRLIKDDDVVWLFSSIIDSWQKYYEEFIEDQVALLTKEILKELEGLGIPIGFLPSQHEANLTGTTIDYFVSDTLGLPDGIRYCDDIRIPCPDRETAKQALYAIDTMVSTKLGLKLSPKKTRIVTFHGCNTFCGYKVYPHHLEVKPSTRKRGQRRLRKQMKLVVEGKFSLNSFICSVASFESLISHTSTTTDPVAQEARAFIEERKKLHLQETCLEAEAGDTIEDT